MNDAMQWLQSCGEFLWDGFLRNAAWKGTLLLAAAWLVDRAWLRRRLLGADVLWTATLLGLLALPLGAAALPRVTLPIWRAPTAIGVPQATVSSVSEAPMAPNDIPVVEKSNGMVAAATPSAASAEGSGKTTAVPFTWPSWSATAAAVYLLGGATLIGRLAWGAASMARLIRRAAPVREQAWLHALAVRKQQLSVGQNVRLLASAETAVPFTAGWRRPVIVVPADVAASAGEATIDATLLHELTHIARGDYPLHLAGKLVEALYWWNPLAWLATARLSAVRESICDGYCCWRMGGCERYGEVLLALAGRLTRRQAGGVGLAMARGSRLGKRLEALTASTVAQPIMRGRQRWGATLLAVAVSFLSAGVTLGTETPAEATLADVIARVKEFENSIETLAGSYHSEVENSYQTREVAIRRNTPQEREEIATNRLAVMAVDRLVSFEWQRGGCERMESEYSSVRTTEGAEKQFFRGKVVSVFDGTKGWSCTTPLDEDGKPLPAEGRKIDSAADFTRPELLPVRCILSPKPYRLSELLAHENAKLVRTETIADRPTVVIEADPITAEAGYHVGVRVWIDSERGVAVRQEAWVYTKNAVRPAPQVVIECNDYREAAPGIWLPMKMEKRMKSIEPDESDQRSDKELVQVRQWKVNVKIPPERFEEAFPTDAKILKAPTPAPAPAPAPANGAYEQSRSAEPSSSAHQLKVIVVDEAEQPIKGALVRQHHRSIPAAPEQSEITKEGNYLTDAAGAATLTCEEESIYLWVVVSHPGRVPLHAVWQRELQATHGPIPEELRFTLKTGTTIGGVVRDEAGKPIAGAKVEIFNLFTAMPTPIEHAPNLHPAPPSPISAAGATQTRPAEQARGVRPGPLPWLAEGETAILTDDEGRWQATNIPSDEELTYSNKRPMPMMALPTSETALPLRLRISHERFASYDGTLASAPRYRNGTDQDETLEGAPSLAALRSGEAVVVLKTQEGVGNADADETGAANKALSSPEEAVDSKEYPDPPKLAYLAWELPPAKNGPQLSRAWNARGEETDEPLSAGTFEFNGKTRTPHAWNWTADTLKLHAHPLVLWFEDGAPFEYRPTLVAVVDADGKKHWRGSALSRRWENLLVSVAAPEKPFAWPEKINLVIQYPIEATQTIEELTTFSDQPIKVAEGVDWMGRVEDDGRFASTLIIWQKPQDEDLTSYGATLIAKDGSRLSNDAGGVVRPFNDRQERVEWYARRRPEEIARVKISRQRRATATIEDVPLRLDLMPRE